MIDVGLVGPGRVGRVLVTLLPRDKFRLGPVMSGTFTSARRATREMEQGYPIDGPEAFALCDVVLIAVQDGVLPGVVEQLSRVRFDWHKRCVLHTSRLRDSSALEPIGRRGAAVASLQPLFIFQRPVPTLAGVHFVVEGEPIAAQMARGLVRAWDGEFQLVRPEQKIHLSIATSFATDIATGVLEAAVQRTTAGGYLRKRGLAAVLAVLRATLEDYSHSGRRSRPGPLLQGDAETVRRYLDGLQSIDCQAAASYQTAALQTLKIFQKLDADFSFLDEEHGTDVRAVGAAAGPGGD